MSPLRERLTFAASLAVLVAGFLGESLFTGKVLSPADVVYAQASFQDGGHGLLYEPLNRLLIDPVLQFQPWLEFNRRMIRSGRLPLWNPYQGCGTPHLANGQSRRLRPRSTRSHTWELFPKRSRSWLPRVFGSPAWGCSCSPRAGGSDRGGGWFAGLAFPFTGFLVVWLQYPVTSVAVWFPWLLLATDLVLLDQPGPQRRVPLPRDGSIPSSPAIFRRAAHLLIAAGLFTCWRCRSMLTSTFTSISRASGRRVRGLQDSGPAPGEQTPIGASRPFYMWTAGIALGIAIGAVAIIPLGFYLSKSPVWTDRAATRPSVWAFGRPRLLDAACTALPYLYGSQRRGQPNLAKALGVHNLNESAGGFAGLATLIWLAPVGFGARNDRSWFLAFLVAAGALAAFEAPLAANLLRVIPVVNVADNRRLTLWVAFGLVLLAGMGLDRLADWRPGRWMTGWIGGWLVAALALVVAAALVPRMEKPLRARALANQRKNTSEGSFASARLIADRVDRQVRQTIQFTPWYFYCAAAHLSIIAILATAAARRAISPTGVRTAAAVLVLTDLFLFGHGMNPAIARGDERPTSAVIAYLQREAAPPARVLAIGAELPPNVLMRYGLSDVRNYDSIESTRNLDWFAPLYEPGTSRSSRRTITWEGVTRALSRLRAANVTAIVGASPPPAEVFDRVDRVGGVWIARLTPLRMAETRENPGEITAYVESAGASRLVFAESYDPGWRAEVDGAAATVESENGTLPRGDAAAGARRVRLIYDPIEARWAVRSFRDRSVERGRHPFVDNSPKSSPKNVRMGLERAERSG